MKATPGQKSKLISPHPKNRKKQKPTLTPCLYVHAFLTSQFFRLHPRSETTLCLALVIRPQFPHLQVHIPQSFLCIFSFRRWGIHDGGELRYWVLWLARMLSDTGKVCEVGLETPHIAISSHQLFGILGNWNANSRVKEMSYST